MKDEGEQTAYGVCDLQLLRDPAGALWGQAKSRAGQGEEKD